MMINKILFVDNDHALLAKLRTLFTQYNQDIKTAFAKNAPEAIAILKENTISLVVTDIRVPHMDNSVMLFLTHLLSIYPDIPVLVTTPVSDPDMKELALQNGAADCLEKPFKFDTLLEKIHLLLADDDMSMLHDVALGSFIQIVEMEQKTCTIKVMNSSSDQIGVLFFKNGNLLDARVNGMTGKAAAYDILTWNQVSLFIANSCAVNKNNLDGNLQAILLESLRRKEKLQTDTSTALSTTQQIHASEIEKTEPAQQTYQILPDTLLTTEAPPSDQIDLIRTKLIRPNGKSIPYIDIYYDNSWDNLLKQARMFEQFIPTGPLAICYLDSGGTNNYVVLPGSNVTVVSVEPNSPRDQIIQALID